MIIVSPLVSGYKYEKLKEKGGGKVHKGVAKGERIEWSKGKGNFVKSLYRELPKVGNSSPQYK